MCDRQAISRLFPGFPSQWAREFPFPVKPKGKGRDQPLITSHTSDPTVAISAYFQQGTRYDITDKDIRLSLKTTAAILQYPEYRGIPLDRIDTHSLRSGGANALSLSGFSDREIQKMGRWRGATFKEYIREELACFSKGMSKKMKRKFGFVNITGGVYHDITPTMLTKPYDKVASAE